MEKSKVGYARLLIGEDIGMYLSDKIDLITEKGTLQKQEVFYECKPIKCTHGKMFGHSEKDCKEKNMIKQV